MAYIGNEPSQASQRIVTSSTATASQTVFNASSGYTLGYIDVYQNGTKLVNGDDYTASNGTSITLTTGALVGDSVELVAFIPRGLTDGYLKSEADAMYLPIASPSYTGALTGGTGVVNLGSGQFYKDASGNVGIGTTTPIGTGANRTVLTINGTSSVISNIAIGGTQTFYQYSDATATQLITKTAIPLALGTNDQERMRIDSSGNVLIGTNSSLGTGQLQLSRNANDGSTRLLISNNSAGSSANSYLIFGNDSSGGYAGLRSSSTTNTSFGGANAIQFFNNLANLSFSTAGVNRVAVTYGGLVGIGIDSPNSPLTVYTTTPSSTGTVYIEQNVATNYPTLRVEQIGVGGNNGDVQGFYLKVDGATRGWNSYIGHGTTQIGGQYNDGTMFMGNTRFTPQQTYTQIGSSTSTFAEERQIGINTSSSSFAICTVSCLYTNGTLMVEVFGSMQYGNSDQRPGATRKAIVTFVPGSLTVTDLYTAQAGSFGTITFTRVSDGVMSITATGVPGGASGNGIVWVKVVGGQNSSGGSLAPIGFTIS